MRFSGLPNSWNRVDLPPTTAQRQSIDQILQAGWYLLELINEILDLALIESGKLSLSREPVSLPELLSECRGMIEPSALKSGIGVTFPTFGDTPFIKADRTRVKQVLINLLSNAIKYNRDGGTVEVICTIDATQRTRISVHDTGNGLPIEKLAQLFQPFNRLGQESGSTEGTGIGLVVSKRLVELMGGEIGVESTVGVGSVFWIELQSTHAPRLLTAVTEFKAAIPARARHRRSAAYAAVRRRQSCELDVGRKAFGATSRYSTIGGEGRHPRHRDGAC